MPLLIARVQPKQRTLAASGPVKPSFCLSLWAQTGAGSLSERRSPEWIFVRPRRRSVLGRA